MIKQLFFIFNLNDALALGKGEPFQAIKAVWQALNYQDEGHGIVHTDLEQQRFYYLHELDEAFSEQKAHELKQMLLDGKLPCDILMSEDFPCFNQEDERPGALVMDMDMTTVQIEGIDEIARRLGVFDEVSAITEEAMHGKLDFSQSLRKRVALLKGGDAEHILADVRCNMPETPGLSDLMTQCNNIREVIGQDKFTTCIASGGFHNLISVIEQKYGINKIRANRLAVDAQGKFTGEVDGPIVDAKAKADLVKELKASGIPQERILVLGDGANDMLMMNEGGLGIAYHAKPKVQAQMLNVLNVGDLSAVAHLLRMRAKFS